MDLIEKRAKIEKKAFDIEGIVGVTDGINRQGKPIIRILLSLPVTNIKLPMEFYDDDIELVFAGHLGIQNVK